MTDTTTSNWQNWSKSLPPSKAQVHTPENLEALSSLVKSHSSGIRPVGSGHSWMPLVPSKTAIVKLDHFGGVGEIDEETQQAWLVLAVAFTTYRLSLPIKAMRLKSRRHRRTNPGRRHQHRHPRYGRNASGTRSGNSRPAPGNGTGEHIEISADQNADWLDGGESPWVRWAFSPRSKCSLLSGLNYTAKYGLSRTTHAGKRRALLAENRNFEFFYIPFSDTNLLITHNVTEEPDTPRNDDNSTSAVMQLKSLRDALKWCSPLRRWLLKRAISKEPTENVIGESWDMLASERNVLSTRWNTTYPSTRVWKRSRKYAITLRKSDPMFSFHSRRERPPAIPHGYPRSTAAAASPLLCIAITKTPLTFSSLTSNLSFKNMVGGHIGASSTA